MRVTSQVATPQVCSTLHPQNQGMQDILVCGTSWQQNILEDLLEAEGFHLCTCQEQMSPAGWLGALVQILGFPSCHLISDGFWDLVIPYGP